MPTTPGPTRTLRLRTHRHERRPEERPGEILEAALTVFAERGYRSARIDDIAEAAGVTKGAVYHHFDTKEDLLCRAIEHSLDAAFVEMGALLRQKTTPASVRIRTMLRRFTQVRADGRRVLTLLLQDLRHEVPEAYRQWMQGGPVQGWTLLARLIDEGRRTREFRPDVDAEVAARLVISGLITQLVWQARAGDVPAVAIDTDRLVDSTIELLLHGLRPVTLTT